MGEPESEHASAPLGDPAAEPTLERADDFMAPVVFRLVARVRREAARVAAQSTEVRGAPWDPEAIHDLRVAIRRLRTVLRPARSLFGRRRITEVATGLRRFANAAGRLRDAEVLRETLAAISMPQRTRAQMAVWTAERTRLEKREREIMVAMVEATKREPIDGPTTSDSVCDSRQDSLGDVLDRLERYLGHRREAAPTAKHVAEATVSAAAGDIARRLGDSPADATAMHDLRIAYKRLRYSAELFAPLLGKRAKVVAKEASRMQKQLGELHDIDAALARVRRGRSLAHATRTAVVRALGRARAACAHAVGRALAVERALLADSREPPDVPQTRDGRRPPDAGAASEVAEGLDPEKATGNE